MIVNVLRTLYWRMHLFNWDAPLHYSAADCLDSF